MTQKIDESYHFLDVLIRPARSTNVHLRDVIRGWWITSRMEFLPDAFVHIGLPLLLVLHHEPWSSKLLLLSFWGGVVWFMGHWVGSSINCLADYPLDRLDTQHKARLAKAIDEAGMRSILLVNLAETLLAIVVSVWLAIQLNKPLLIIFWFTGLIIATLYSFEPVHFKRRNWLNPIALDLIVYAMPLFFIYHVLSPVWNGFDVAVLIIYCFQMVPMFLVDEVSDHDEDKALGIYNPCVTYGRFKVSWLANSIYILACLASLIAYVTQTEIWSFTRLVMLVLAVLAYAWVAREFVLLAKHSQLIAEASNETEREKRNLALKNFSKTPAWLVGTSIGALLLAVAETFF